MIAGLSMMSLLSNALRDDGIGAAHGQQFRRRTRPLGIGPTKPGCCRRSGSGGGEVFPTSFVSPPCQGRSRVSPDDDRPTKPGERKAGSGSGRERAGAESDRQDVATGEWAASGKRRARRLGCRAVGTSRRMTEHGKYWNPVHCLGSKG